MGIFCSGFYSLAGGKNILEITVISPEDTWAGPEMLPLPPSLCIFYMRKWRQGVISATIVPALGLAGHRAGARNQSSQSSSTASPRLPGQVR